MDIITCVNRSLKARAQAHKILAEHESSASRVILLEDLLKKISGSPVDVQDYFKEAIKRYPYLNKDDRFLIAILEADYNSCEFQYELILKE